MNTFGRIFRVTSFGESHGKALGGIIDGIPSNILIDIDKIQNELDRRKPGQSDITTQRKEQDKVVFLSGLKDNVTLGNPIAFIIENKDQQSKDYSDLKEIYRPSHADYTYQMKYGIREENGGGRASARETVVRVVAGAIAKQILSKQGIEISAFTKAIGSISIEEDIIQLKQLGNTSENIVRCPEEETSIKMIELIKEVKKEGDSIGGVVRCIIEGVPVGWGEPIYDKLSARLAYAMMSINAAKAFILGNALDLSKERGSVVNDSIRMDDDNNIKFKSNNSAGIQGGISNGEGIYFDVAFKPTATISKEQETVNHQLKDVTISTKGRHDPCIVPRAIPIVEAMAAIVLLDMALLRETNNIKNLDI